MVREPGLPLAPARYSRLPEKASGLFYNPARPNAVRLTVRGEPFDKLRRALSNHQLLTKSPSTGSGRTEFFLNEQYCGQTLLVSGFA